LIDAISFNMQPVDEIEMIRSDQIMAQIIVQYSFSVHDISGF